MDYTKIEQGDLVDFGPYGKLYVCNLNYHDDYFWVTDDEYERDNKKAPGWSILKELAVKVIEHYQDEDDDIEECLHPSQKICPNCYKLLYEIGNFLHAILVEAPDIETAKSLILMRCNNIKSILEVNLATDEDKKNGIPLLTENTPIEEAEEYLVSYKIDPINFNISGRIKADGERDAKKRFSNLKPEAKIINVQRAKSSDKIYPVVS